MQIEKETKQKAYGPHGSHQKKISILFRNEDACIEIYIYIKKSSIIYNCSSQDEYFFLLVSLYHELWPPFWALELT